MNTNNHFGKKILTTFACGLMLASTANADLARAEMGIGTWLQTPSGNIAYTDGATTALDSSDEATQAQIYAWLLVKHPIPVLPNLRLEYVNTVNEGTATGTFGTYDFSLSPSANTELSMTQIDFIPYYNILDNTGWITLDLGLDIKIMDISYETLGVDLMSKVPNDISLVVLPLAYVRTRFQTPGTDIGLEADIKYISYSSVTVYDARIKVDYTFDVTPVFQPALEIGYRVQKVELDIDEIAINVDYSGIYIGAMLRF